MANGISIGIKAKPGEDNFATTIDTVVYCKETGDPIRGITRIELKPVNGASPSMWEAVLTLYPGELDLEGIKLAGVIVEDLQKEADLVSVVDRYISGDGGVLDFGQMHQDFQEACRRRGVAYRYVVFYPNPSASIKPSPTLPEDDQ